MKFVQRLTLYMALCLGANAVLADAASLNALREGDMKKLNFHETPKEVAAVEFVLADSAGTATLADYQGKYVLLNFWATWCAPCRKEMPYFDKLQAEMGSDGFEVLALSLDRASVAKIETFYQSINVENLTIYREPSLRIGTEAGVLGMPITLVLDRQGREIARLQGEAKWDGPEAISLLGMITEALDAAEG